jgi:GMP synthase (glutamine-hydrolysing)
MTRPFAAARVLVVEHEPGAGASLVGDWLGECGVTLDVCRPHSGDPVPERLTHDGLLVLGGAMGALEDEVAPWLPAVRSLLRHAVHHEVPVWGICLGAQLLAAAMGGQVVLGPAGPEVGVLPLQFEADDDPVFGAMPRVAHAVQFHQDSVGRLPHGATLLASSPRYANQVFRVGSCAWGVQCHPEVTAAQVAEWARDESVLLGCAGVDAEEVVHEVRLRQRELQAVWAPATRRWAALVQARADRRP